MARALVGLLRSITPAEALAGASISLVLMGACLAAAVLVVTLWPPDHFVRPSSPWQGKHPVVRVAGHFGKNALGLVLVVAGVLMSLPGVPGPGLAVVFIGLTLVDFPGKRRVELWVLGRPSVHRVIDRVRARFGREPLVLVDPHDAAGSAGDARDDLESGRRAS